MRVMRSSTRLLDFMVFIGPWACRFSFVGPKGRFGNGSSWRSGWFRWQDDPDF